MNSRFLKLPICSENYPLRKVTNKMKINISTSSAFDSKLSFDGGSGF